MSVSYRDYYADLGVSRTATQPEIQRAYRKLARQHHPDVDKSPGATQRFQRIAEAYEVLKDPKSRERYDKLGSAWKDGQEFTPPQGWQTWQGSAGDFGADFGGFSEFFESLFGRRGASPFAGHDFGARPGRRGGRMRGGRDVEAEIEVPFETAIGGGSLTFQLDAGTGSPRTIEVRVPAGSASGSVLRLRAQGGAGEGAPGDLLLRLAVQPPEGFEVEGDDLHTSLVVLPHDAVLGARVPLRGPEGGEIVVTLPPGTSTGRVLRLRGQGMPRAGGGRGDLLAEVAIVVPERPSEAEREHYEALRRLRPGSRG